MGCDFELIGWSDSVRCLSALDLLPRGPKFAFSELRPSNDHPSDTWW